MLALTLGLPETAACMGGAAADPLDLNFATATYQSSGTSYALTALPGYSNVRTGAVSYYNGTNATDTIDDFAANVAPVVSNGVGYKAYGAQTNMLSSSQAAAPLLSSVTASANVATAPDGTSTADKVIPNGTNTSNHFFGEITTTGAAGTFTQSIYAKAAGYSAILVGGFDGTSYRQAVFDLLTGTVAATFGGAAGYIIDCGNGWYRCIVVATTTGAWGSTSGIVCWVPRTTADAFAGGTTSFAGDGTSGIDVWQHQLLTGTFADGGPIIATSGATASIGAPTLTLQCPNGSYTATYTFDDNSTQDIVTVVSTGTFTMPTLGTLNRATVKRVVVK